LECALDLHRSQY